MLNIYFNGKINSQISSSGFEFNLMDADSESSESLNSDKEQIISTSPQVSSSSLDNLFPFFFFFEMTYLKILF